MSDIWRNSVNDNEKSFVDMCRHVLNAKVFVQAACCNNWYECFECHDEVNDHAFQCGRFLRMSCKLCRRVFQKDLGMIFESDKKCENCKEEWCIPGITPESVVYEEGQTEMGNLLSKLMDAAAKELG